MGHETDKEERKRLNDIVLHNEKKIAAKVANKQKKNDKDSQEAARLAAIILEFNKKAVDYLKGYKLKDQFLAFRAAGAPIPKGVHKGSVVGKLKYTIKAAIDKYNEGEWALKDGNVQTTNTQESDEEIFPGYDDDDDDDEQNWEDEE